MMTFGAEGSRLLLLLLLQSLLLLQHPLSCILALATLSEHLDLVFGG